MNAFGVGISLFFFDVQIVTRVLTFCLYHPRIIWISYTL